MDTMRKASSLITPGTRYGLLVVEGMAEAEGERRYHCQCDCARRKVIAARHLKSGATTSCGCLSRAKSRERIARVTKARRRHGMCDHPLYKTWEMMRERCNSPHATAYKRYGGRGIKVDPRWDDFAQFVRDMGDKPGPEYTIDRIDNGGNYKPSNCRWATPTEQAANRG